MASYILALCIVLIWSVSSAHLASQNHCRHKATLYIDWMNFNESTSIFQYDSGKIFDVLRNHCIEITLENIKAQEISCKADLLDGITAIFKSYHSGSSATIKINSITDTMSTKWICDIEHDNNIPILRILFELKVKGAKGVKMEINNNKTPFTIQGLDEPKYDGVIVYQYNEGEHIDVKCKNDDGDLILIFCYYVDRSGDKLCFKDTEIKIWLKKEYHIAYIDCIINNKGLRQTFVYGYIFEFNDTEGETSTKKSLTTTTIITTESSGYKYHKNNTVTTINDKFKEKSSENHTRTTTHQSMTRSLNPLKSDHTENSDYEHNKNNTVPSINDQFNKQPVEKDPRVTNDSGVEMQEIEYDPIILVIGCVVGIIAISVVACCTVVLCMRKRNANSLKNELMEMSFEDGTTTPEPQNPVNNYIYDYAYQSNDSILPRQLPPCPIQQKSLASELKKDSGSNDEEYHYYCEIDENFINKRNAIGQQKHVNLINNCIGKCH